MTKKQNTTMTQQDVDRQLIALDRLASMMDDKFHIPGIKIRFGMDSLVGLLPGIGDLASLISHGYVISTAYRLGVRKRVQLRMLLNAIVDVTGGTMPIIGDLFDVFWKSNRRNVQLLRDELLKNQRH